MLKINLFVVYDYVLLNDNKCHAIFYQLIVSGLYIYSFWQNLDELNGENPVEEISSNKV